MKQIIAPFMLVLRRGILLLALVCLFNLVGWFGSFNQPSYAVLNTNEAFNEIEKDQAMQNPKKAYEKATKVSADPKMGVEKKYEENLKEYYNEKPNADESGVLEKVKELGNKITNNE